MSFKIHFSPSVDSETSSIHSMAMERSDQLSLVDGELEDTDELPLLERYVFTAVNEGNLATLHKIFNDFSNTTAILQLLVTIAYPNDDGFYGHDPEVEKDAEELLGLNCSNVTAMVAACILGEEEMAIMILEFVNKITEEIEAKKVLYEFLGRAWGSGNTILHLAAFMGMSDLVKRLLELGANPAKLNERKYKPVDCADDTVTRNMFTVISELKPLPKSRGSASEDEDSVSDGIKKHKKLIDHPQRTSPNSSPGAIKKRRAMSDAATTMPPTAAESNIPRIDTKPLKHTNTVLSKPTTTSPSTLTRQKKPVANSSVSIVAGSDPNKKRIPKFLRKVAFDPLILIFDICHFGDPEDNVLLPTLRSYLGLNLISSAKDKPAPLKKANPSLKMNVNEIYTPYQWLSPLHLACSFNQIHIAELLLSEAGSMVNLRDREGWTPLHCASAEGNIEIIKLLGRCQGQQLMENEVDEENEGSDWFYPPDGPIELLARNSDTDTPEAVAIEDKNDEIEALFKDLKTRYPQPPEEPIVITDEIESDDSQDDNEEEEDDKYEGNHVLPSKSLGVGINSATADVRVSHDNQDSTSEDEVDDQVSLPTPAAASKISEGVENIPIISTSGDDRLVSDASFVPESQGNQKSVLEPILESPSVSTKITLEQEKLDGNSAVVQVLESGNKVVLLQENDDQVSPSFKETTTTHSPAAIAVSSITLSSEATPASALSVFINPLALEDVKQVVQSPLPAQGISASSLISDASKLAKDYPCLSPPVSLLVTNNLSSEKSPSPKILDKVPSEDKIVSGRATMPLKAWSISTSTGSLNKNNSKEDINSSSSPKMRTRTFSTELFVGKAKSATSLKIENTSSVSPALPESASPQLVDVKREVLDSTVESNQIAKLSSKVPASSTLSKSSSSHQLQQLQLMGQELMDSIDKITTSRENIFTTSSMGKSVSRSATGTNVTSSDELDLNSSIGSGGKLSAKSKSKSASLGNIVEGGSGISSALSNSHSNINNTRHDFASLTKLGDELLRSVDSIKKILGETTPVESQSTSPSRKPSSKIPVSASPIKSPPPLPSADEATMIQKVSMMLERQLPNLNGSSSSSSAPSPITSPTTSPTKNTATRSTSSESSSLSLSSSSSKVPPASYESKAKPLTSEGAASKFSQKIHQQQPQRSDSILSSGSASSPVIHTTSPSAKSSTSFFSSTASPKKISINEIPLLSATATTDYKNADSPSLITPSMILSQQNSKSSLSGRESVGSNPGGGDSKIPRSRRLSAGKNAIINSSSGESTGTGGALLAVDASAAVGTKGSVAARRRSLDRRTKEAASGLFITTPTNLLSPGDGPLSPGASGGVTPTSASASRRASIIHKPRTRSEVQKGDFSWMKAPSYSSSTGNIAEILISSNGVSGEGNGRPSKFPAGSIHHHQHHLLHSHSSNFSTGPVSTADTSSSSPAVDGTVRSRVQIYAKQSSAPVMSSFSKPGSASSSGATATTTATTSSPLKNTSLRASSNTSLNMGSNNSLFTPKNDVSRSSSGSLSGKPQAVAPAVKFTNSFPSPGSISNNNNLLETPPGAETVGGVGIKERIKSFEILNDSDSSSPSFGGFSATATLSRSKSSSRGQNREMTK